MKKLITIFVCLFCLSGILPGQTPKLAILTKTPFNIGESITFHSQQLNEDRTLNIYLPASYHPDSLRKYPVIYLLDGSADEDFIHTVGIVQFGTYPWINMLPESIVVGIANVDRKRDFTFPTMVEQDKKDFPTTGGSASFIQFLEQELQPFIEQNYRTNDTTTIIGQSLGGLLATEILFKQPEMFMNYIIVSPSIWWDGESLLNTEAKQNENPIFIYITAGVDEDPVMVQDVTALAGKLAQYKRSDLSLYFKLFEGQNHGNILHLAIYEAFGKLFTKK